MTKVMDHPTILSYTHHLPLSVSLLIITNSQLHNSYTLFYLVKLTNRPLFIQTLVVCYFDKVQTIATYEAELTSASTGSIMTWSVQLARAVVTVH